MNNKVLVVYDTVYYAPRTTELQFLAEPVSGSKGYDRTNILQSGVVSFNNAAFFITGVTLSCSTLNWWDGASFELQIGRNMALVTSLNVARSTGMVGSGSMLLAERNYQVVPVLRWARAKDQEGVDIVLALEGVLLEDTKKLPSQAATEFRVLQGTEQSGVPGAVEVRQVAPLYGSKKTDRVMAKDSRRRFLFEG